MKTLCKIICTLIFFAAAMALSAQNRDEYDVVKRYNIPASAVPIETLELVKGVYQHRGMVYSGLAYELYANRKPMRVITLHKGVQHGPMYLWYPDGAPQMSANYNHGRLHGRFLGWYQNGGVIYDMVVNHGGFGGDFLYETDSSRETTDTQDTEREAVDND